MVLVSSPRRLLPQVAVCSAGFLFGALSFHLFARSDSPPLSETGEPVSARRDAVTARLPASPPRALAPAASSSRPLVDEAELDNRLRKMLRSDGDGFTRSFKQLVTWANCATEDELKLALKLGPALVHNEAQRDLIDTVVLGRLAEIDGALAMEALGAAERERSAKLPYEARQALFESWAAWDPEGALKEVLVRCHEGEDQDNGMLAGHVITEIGREFPHLARDVATGLARADDEEMRAVGFKAHADLLGQQLDQGATLAAALAWVAATQVSAEERGHLLGSLVQRSLANDAPAETLAVFRQMDPATSVEVASQLILHLAASDPLSAKELQAALPEGKTRQRTADRLVAHLVEQEGAVGAFDWLATQPVHADFDTSYERLAKILGPADGRTAWACVTRMTDEAERKGELSYNVAFRWLAADFAAAARELPSQYVERFQRSTAVLRELTGLFPGMSPDLSFKRERVILDCVIP